MGEDLDAKAGKAIINALSGEPFVNSIFPKNVVKALDAAEEFKFGANPAGSRERELARSLVVNEDDLELTCKFHSGTLDRDYREGIRYEVKAAYRRIEEAVAQGMGVDVGEMRKLSQARNDMYDWEAIVKALQWDKFKGATVDKTEDKDIE
ncbi:hypothetical protein HY032_01215 [Candidatus Gottesmanbacteria bacterium]|nr:hypothetical protein [Candidatus Gottesmanbacteria bacterium]